MVIGWGSQAEVRESIEWTELAAVPSELWLQGQTLLDLDDALLSLKDPEA